MKILFIVLLFLASLLGDDLLNIHRKLVPMTLLQVKNIAQKSDKTIKIVIITNENELIKAQKFQKLLPSKIKGYSLESKIIDETQINKLVNMEYDSIYAFTLKKQNYEFIANEAQTKKAPTISNSIFGLKNGILLFIDKKKRIKIYINKQTMKLSKVPFSSKFLSIVELYDE
jgi:hypothetical protein